MKVLHISSARTFRGGEHQICLLVSELAKLGIKSVVLCPSGSELSKREIAGLDKLVTYMKLTPANLLVSSFIKKLAELEDIDIIHLHDPHSHQFAFYSYKLFSNKTPCVVTRRVSFLIKRTSRPYYSHAMVKRIICVSDSVKQSLSNLSLDQSKLKVIPSGIVLEKDSENYSLREKYHIDADTKIIANLAAISPQKDFMTFVRTAHAFIQSSEEKVKFVIIGADQGSKEQVKNLIRELGLDDHFIFTGFISKAYRYLSEIDVLLSTSVSEGLGNTIQEAMKYEIPIVATNCEGTVDLVEHRKTALMADVGDHIGLASLLVMILTESDLAAKLTKNAHIAIQQFDIRATSKQVQDLYADVLSKA